MATGILNPPAEKTFSRPGTPPAKTFDLSRFFAEEMERSFGDFGVRWGRPFARPFFQELWSPEMEVKQEFGRLHVRVDLPGVTKEAIKVEITEAALMIEGMRDREIENEENGYYRTERSYGRFARTIPLPEGVRIETARATLVNGVLEIVVEVPEVTAPMTRRLAIE